MHRRVVERKVGGPIYRRNVVHHIDGNKLNNFPENLRVMRSDEHWRIYFGRREKNRFPRMKL
ncbi:MAG TPA: HNH endonuclease [Candidatus Lokiarchaeia archaeon]|nr:HNH endonuclease [Candidatus Lokiarchaeia archaeon]